MIKRLFEQVISAISEEADAGQPSQGRDDAIRLATAVLMVDVAQADDVFDESEFNRVLALIEKHFKLEPQLAAELLNEASEEAAISTSTRIRWFLRSATCCTSAAAR